MRGQRDVHVVWDDGWWRVEAEGMTLAETRTQPDAIRIAQAIAREHRRTLLIHGMNGEIRDRDASHVDQDRAEELRRI
jgi:hypothetical protein